MTANKEMKTWFSQEIENLLDVLFGVAVRLTRNEADAEDLVAESVSLAWSRIGSLTERSSFRPWLFRILHNCFISDYRKKSVRPTESVFDEQCGDDGAGEISSLLMEQPDGFLDWWANPEDTCINDMLGEQIELALSLLPEVFRTTVLLVNVEGLTYDEAAEVLGVPKGTIRSRMKRGRTLLQKNLWKHAVEHGLTTTGSEKWSTA
jgi:RNA polymerase sigma-70 factor (ECF subfamily)